MLCIVNACATGKRLKEEMQRRKISVRDISVNLNVSTQTVYKWLSGRTLPSLENMVVLCAYLGVAMDELIVRETKYDGTIPEYMIREEGLFSYAC